MGWSVDLVRPDLDALFKGMEREYDITHPETSSPTIMIRHQGDILPIGVVRIIAKLFPEFVYLHFIPNSVFPVGESMAEKH